jgi:hypothetical protein
MKSKGTIAAIKQSIMDSLARDADVGKIRGYDSEGYISHKTKLPAYSVQRGARRRGDKNDFTAGHMNYVLPLRISFLVEPTRDGAVDDKLYLLEEGAESQLNNDFNDGLLHNSIVKLTLSGAFERPVYHIDNINVYAHAVIMTYDIHYEVDWIAVE